MKRKILSLILVFAMTVSLLTVGTGAVEPTYGDTAGHWAEDSIERWSGHGIIQGSNGEFDPNGQLTCAQLATILAKLLKLPAAKDAGFTDSTADAWYYDAINRCAAAGILNGNGDGTVTPEAPISRERAMVMLARALGIEPIRKPDLTKYTDAAQVSAYAQGYVAALIEAGIVGGVTADELAPQANINRASTVTILDRAISTYADQAGTTVKADGKGIVLVVAENVKITGAPEGTKIVVADGATGLTVNGKSVSDDQTYIVPKTTTSSGSSSGGYSHSHSYDATTHKCSCGEFDPAVVATIGNTNGYLTLEAAVAAAQSGDTVTLAKDANMTDTIRIEGGKKITLALNNHNVSITEQGKFIRVCNAELTVTGPGAVKEMHPYYSPILIKGGPAGSANYSVVNVGSGVTLEGWAGVFIDQNNGNNYGIALNVNEATLNSVNDVFGDSGSAVYVNGSITNENNMPKITLTNATLEATGAGMYLAGYADTTISGGSVEGTATAIEIRAGKLTLNGGSYTASAETYNCNPNGNGTTTSGAALAIAQHTTKKNINVMISGGTFTGVKALSESNPQANDPAPEVTLSITDGTFNGGVTIADKDHTSIAGGTFSTEPANEYIAKGYTKESDNGKWNVVPDTSKTYVAQVGVNKYESLADALAAAKNGDTVKLVGDTTLRSSVEINKSITLDLNGKAIHYTGETQDSATQTHRALNVTDGNVTIKSGSITTTVAGTDYSTEFDAVVVKSGADVTLKDMNITINDAKGSCLYVFEGGKATVKSGSYTNTNTSGEKLLLNQKDNKPQAIFVEGGTFDGRTPESGDNSGNPSTFLAPDYKSVETSAGSGVWTVSKMTWDEYPEDASVVPSGLVITEYPQNAFDSSNGKTGTITIKDKDALLYFAYRLDLAKAYAECGEKAHGTGWGHTCIWYGGAYARHIVLDANIDLGGMTLENGFGNMKDFAFDGHNHKISNVTINYTGTGNTGLFVGGNRGISNLVVENVKVTAGLNGTENAAGIVSSDANALITNVTVRNSSVTGGKYTGAIVGYNYGSVTNCKVENCTVSGRYKVGGIIGYICNSNDVPTYVTGNTLTGVTVKGEDLVAGKNNFVIGKIVGNWNATTGECSNNKFSGTTDATGDIGEIESRCIVTVNGALHCTLAQFNALTSIPAAAKKVYVDLGNASLQGGLTIGNEEIADHYHYTDWNNDVAPDGYPLKTNINNSTTHDGEKIRYIYSTGKSAVNIILTGSVTGATDTGDFNAGAITLKVPDAANVIFDTVTFGEGQMAMSMWTESHVQSMTVSHRLASVTFNGCTFKGNWLQNGAFGADEMTITGCTFEKHENTAGIKNGFDCKNNSNPIWIQNMGQTNVTIEGCTINAVRPIKLWEQGANGSVTIRGNTFNMEKCSIDEDNTHKNIAIMFCGTTEQVKLGNVEISGNTVTGNATSLICFYNGKNDGENHYPAMNEGATFRLYDNILPEGTALSVIWTTATVWAPTYVPIPQ